MNDVVLIHGNFSSKDLNEQVLKIVRKKICFSDKVCKSCVFYFEKTPIINFFSTDSKVYKIKDIDLICKTMNLQLYDKEQFFFIIKEAEKLIGFAANKLLKRIEEPQAGFHFIFSTNNKELLLDTVYSRCNFFIYLKKKLFLSNLDDLVIKFNDALEKQNYEIVFNLSEMDESSLSDFIDHYLKVEISEKPLNNFKIPILFWAQEFSPISGSCKQFLQLLFLKLLKKKNEFLVD